uniref:Uncharacterized protein n=1 Tax=Timema genevievae TaxID=629358 RepID=A0A7R9K1I5_TIMGE|nr:unnamed protein product [Timema genevievae]
MDGSKTSSGPRIEDYLKQSGIDYEEATKAAINIQRVFRGHAIRRGLGARISTDSSKNPPQKTEGSGEPMEKRAPVIQGPIVKETPTIETPMAAQEEEDVGDQDDVLKRLPTASKDSVTYKMYGLSLLELQKQTQFKQDQTLGSPTSGSRVKVDTSSGCCNIKLGHTRVVAGTIQGSGAWGWSRTGAILDSRNKGWRTSANTVVLSNLKAYIKIQLMTFDGVVLSGSEHNKLPWCLKIVIGCSEVDWIELAQDKGMSLPNPVTIYDMVNKLCSLKVDSKKLKMQQISP